MRGRPISPSRFCTMGVLLLLLLLQQAKGASHSEVGQEQKVDFSYWQTWGGADPGGYEGPDEYDGDDLGVFLDAQEENSTDTPPSEAPDNTNTPVTLTSSTTITTTIVSTASMPSTTTTTTTPTTTTASTTTTTSTSTTISPDEGSTCCECPSMPPHDVCQPDAFTSKVTCPGPLGFIIVDPETSNAKFDFEDISTDVMVRIPISAPLSEKWEVTFNDGIPIVGEGKIFVLKPKDIIKVHRIRGADSNCTLEYVMYEPCNDTMSVPVTSTTSGQLKPPRDPTGIFKYRPNVKCLWSFDMVEEGYGFDLVMDQVDLDGITHVIDPNLPLDFLLVGKGADVLSGQDVMFFGELDRVVHVSVDRPTAHVYLQTSPVHLFTESQGFRVNYTVTGSAVTSPSSTTPPPPTVPTVFSETRVPLNGMPHKLAWENAKEVRGVLANMAMLFASDKQLQLDRNITEKDVVILNINTCDRRFCLAECSAYNFTVTAKSAEAEAEDEEWAFPRELLEEMIATRKWHEMWETMEPKCKICLDEITVTTSSAWYWYLVAGVVLLAVAALASVGVRRATLLKWTERQEALKRKKDQQEAEDRRRKVSGGPSLLGGSIASRFSMPFPSLQRLREDEKHDGDDEEEDSGDEGGRGSQDGGPGGEYHLFDPDLGRVNISQFGLERELVSGLHAVTATGVGKQPTDHCYTNRAFVADDDEVDGGGAGGDGSSSTDSDSDVLHFSRNRIRPNTHRGPEEEQQPHHVSLTQATTAQVHAPDINTDETSL